jgi:hypothetical protein
MAKGVGSCVDPVGVEGEWLLLKPEQTIDQLSLVDGHWPRKLSDT